MHNYLKKLRAILIQPEMAFKEYSKEKYTVPLRFMAMSYILILVILCGAFWLGGLELMKVLKLVKLPFNYLGFVIISTVVYYIFSRLLSSRITIWQTFKVFAYLSALTLLSSAITALSIFVPVPPFLVWIVLTLWGLWIAWTGLKLYTKLSNLRLFLTFLFSILTLTAALISYVLMEILL